MVSHRMLKYGDVLSTDFGVYVLGCSVDAVPEREVEAISIPGRSGDLHIDHNRFKNILINYSMAVINGAEERFRGFINAIHSIYGVQRIEDSINPEVYRMGILNSVSNPTVSFMRDLFVFEMVFDCGPQRWLKEGELEIACENGTTLYNPTLFDAKPLIKIDGTATGTITINGIQIEITENPGRFTIDCQTEDAYNSRTLASYNSKVTLSSGFPKLSPGENEVTTSSGMTFTMIPRYWMI